MTANGCFRLVKPEEWAAYDEIARRWHEKRRAQLRR
jgi:hypothetical protein